MKKPKGSTKQQMPTKGMYWRNFFPELRETEDEKIRKWIINEIKIKHHNLDEENVDFADKAIAWLEKQEGCEIIRKEWFEHIKQSWYKEGFIDGKYSGVTSKEWTINDTTTLNELIDFLENGTAKLQHDLTRYANWLKIQFTPIEKQGEQKPVDKAEPKFKVGDWITDGKALLYITKFETDYGYELKAIDGEVFHFVSPDFVEANYHLWTIQDAKDGDVLVSLYNKPFIYNGNRDSFHIGSYCGISVVDTFNVATEKCHWTENKNIYPATKEQRDLLFLKMQEKGYEWNADTKELKKIEQKSDSFCKKHCKGYQETGKCFADGECKAKREAEQKSAWSEDDERMLHTIIADFKGFIRDNTSTLESHFNECIDWLKSLRPQNRWKPSDEQMKALNYVVNLMASSESPKENDYYYNVFKDLRKQLKKLKEEKV